MQIDNLFQSKTFKAVIIGLLTFAVLAVVFGIGVSVGIRRAEFSFQWAEQYHKNFAGPANGFFSDIDDRQFTETNGSFGKIINMTDNTITITGADNVEKNIVITPKTVIVCQRNNLKISDLNVGDTIVVLGNPDNTGKIQAGLIRVLPNNGQGYIF